MKHFFAHPATLVESEDIGEETRVWAFTHIMNGVTVGARCNIGENCFLEAGAVVGNDVTIKNGNCIWDGVTLGNGVFVGPNVTFTNDLHPRSPRLPQAVERYRNHNWLTPTYVEKGASIGAAAVILAGNTIGEFAMVAAGAVVTKDVPPHALVAGVPARVAGWVCQCGCRIRFAEESASCAECGLEYRKDGTLVLQVNSAAAVN